MQNSTKKTLNKNQIPQSLPLHSLFRNQIVQNYPPSSSFSHPIFIQQQLHEEKQPDFMDYFMRDNDIVEEYMEKEEEPKRRGFMNFDNMMAEESELQIGGIGSRNSSLSSRDHNFNVRNKSFDKMPNMIMKSLVDDQMDIQSPINDNKKNYFTFNIPQIQPRINVPCRQQEKNEKITKIQEIGCNCRKSKCLKMYCQCFHLQIFCNQNCSCIDCGNVEPNEGHQKAVLDALTRNPKAFEQQNPSVQNGFTLGVQLAQVKKGCKCKKTKCLKKYCECYNSGSKCGKFCKCESCENN